MSIHSLLQKIFQVLTSLISKLQSLILKKRQLSLDTKTCVDILIQSLNEAVCICHGRCQLTAVGAIDFEIPVQLTYGSITGSVTEGLFEPVDKGKLLKQVLAARVASQHISRWHYN